MNLSRKRRSRTTGTWIVAPICAALAGVLLIACSTSSTQSASNDSVASGSEATPLPLGSGTASEPIPTLPSLAEAIATHQAFSTALALHAVAIQTNVSLTPHPTIPAGPFYLESPIPTPTWRVGYAGGEMPENTFNPEYDSCWYGYLADKLLSVCAGHEQFGGNPQQGVIRIRVLELDQVTAIVNDVYETPGAFGVVHILVADSSSVTVASEDGQAVFTFDIATRQWVPNPPSVLPTASP